MDLREIAAISGQSGLFKVLKPTRTGVILESLDESKTKVVANASSKVSILKEISIYTHGSESNKPLEEVLDIINKQYGDELPVSAKSSSEEYKSFFISVLPDYDSDRVYVSDIKKLVIWYGSLKKYCPAIFDSLLLETEASDTEVTETEAPKEVKVVRKTTQADMGGSKIKQSQNTTVKNVTKSTSSKRGS